MKEKVFITGWKGFIGKRLTEYLKSLSYEVGGCDIKDDQNFKLMNNNKLVVHCAAYVSVTESNCLTKEYFINNVLNLIDLIKNNGRIIFLSTGGALYGNDYHVAEDMADIDKITNPYALTKLVGEWLIRYYCDDYLILRLANVYGQGQDERGEANCFTHFRKDNPIILYGENQERDFIKVDDVCKAIERGIRKHIKGTYNIGSGEKTIVRNIAESFSVRRNVKIKNMPKRKGEVDFITLNIDKAKKAGLL